MNYNYQAISKQIKLNPNGIICIMAEGQITNYCTGSKFKDTRSNLTKYQLNTPILVQAPDGHTAWANTKALK